MKRLIVLLSCLLSFSVAGEAGAALFTFDETFLGGANDGTRLNINNKTYSFVFDLAASDNYYRQDPAGMPVLPTADASGYLAADMTITSAVLYYSFSDNDWNPDPVKVITGVGDGGLTIADYGGSNQLNLGRKQDPQSFSYTFALADLAWLADGKLSVSINSSDSIRVDQLRLLVQAQAPDAAQPVPLPNAAWLFGAGLIGVVGIKRKASA